MRILSVIKNIFSNDFYVQIWPENLRILNITTGESYEDVPLITLKYDRNGKPVIEAIGSDSNKLKNCPGYKVLNPFDHPRLLVKDFQAAEKVLMHTFRLLHQSKIFAPSPRVIIQPMEKLEGGVTDVEMRLYRELCLGAGSREVVVYLGKPLHKSTINYEQVKSKSS
ncbi:MAG: hypothetical protein K6L76_02505 [Agarilytica sp.]